MNNWSEVYFSFARDKREEREKRDKRKSAAIGSNSRDIDLKMKAITIKSFC